MRVFLPVALFAALAVKAEPIGLVLAGGGAKGAYEIGVWKAICELKLDRRIGAISGSSVGSINAALFGAIGDPAECERLWRQSVSSAFCCNSNTVRKAVQPFLEDMDRNVAKAVGQEGELTRKGLAKAAAESLLAALLRGTAAVKDATLGTNSVCGICDTGRLRRVLAAGLPPGKFVETPAVYATAVNKKTNRRMEFRLNGLGQSQVIDRLLASAAVPVAFDTAEVDGEQYLDGGYELMGGDNEPITPIVDNHPEIKTVIVVYLCSRGKGLHRIPDGRQPGIRIIEIIPSKDIGGAIRMFDTSKRQAEDLISLGYGDARQVLAGLNL